ncbi:MAG: epoxyqueuosine reductase QueH [Kiritimatiellae bacterium]|nr:epoxyqueuosine reductase QueH [Kiritimatiellia bacterium]
MKILLHVCCGPCASACVPVLKDCGHDVAMFYSNSNIAPEEEYAKRGENAAILAAAEGVEIVQDSYDHADWLEKVAKGLENEPEKGARCARCFLYNLRRTAKYAREHGFDAFTTSLTVSPHKVSGVIFAAGAQAAKENGSKFVEADFKKKNGFLKSLARAAALGLYRQSWCGCEFSMRKQHTAGKAD